jgi:hypothetical protein
MVLDAARVARGAGKNLAPDDGGARMPWPYVEWSVRHRLRWAGKLRFGADGSTALFS